MIMEETVANVQLEVNELHHRDITPSQRICKEIKNVAVIAEEITENPEYVVMHRSITVQAITNEEVVIPKQDPALHQRPHLSVACPEGVGSMETDPSSQESAMDIASQESLSVKDSNSEEPHYCDHRVSVSLREEAISAREVDVRKREEAILAKEMDFQKREESVLECEKRLINQEEDIAVRRRAMLEMEMVIQERRESLNIQAKQIADRELTLKKREAAVQIRELEADGYKVILQSCKNNGNGCLPAKRTKKN